MEFLMHCIGQPGLLDRMAEGFVYDYNFGCVLDFVVLAVFVCLVFSQQQIVIDAISLDIAI